MRVHSIIEGRARGSHLRLLVLAVWALHLCGCTPRTAPLGGTLRIATTTSTQNSGLMDVLVKRFETTSNIDVVVRISGTGEALDRARRGEADLVLVHDRAAEDRFLAEGHGINRRSVMYNDFVLLGPISDPAGLKDFAVSSGSPDVVAALARLRERPSPYVSRADRSGTHVREEMLWTAAGGTPEEDWYLRTGLGMLEALQEASVRRAYVLADRGTYLAHRDDLELEIVVDGDKRLFNPYGVMAVNPLSVDEVAFARAMRFIDFLTSPEAIEIIRGHGTERFGQALFTPIEDSW